MNILSKLANIRLTPVQRRTTLPGNLGTLCAGLGLALSLATTACSSPYFFPKTKPLFAGLDESTVPESKKLALAHAKVDFSYARQKQPPVYAHYSSDVPYTHSRVYTGDGYQLTMVNNDLIYVVAQGPDITIQPSVTGGAPYHYDEIDRSGY